MYGPDDLQGEENILFIIRIQTHLDLGPYSRSPIKYRAAVKLLSAAQVCAKSHKVIFNINYFF